MGYLERPSSANKGGVAVMVAVIQAVGIYAVVSALGNVLVTRTIDHPLGTWNEPRETVVPADPPKRPVHDRTLQKPVDGDAREQVVTFDTGLKLDPGPLNPPDWGDGTGTVTRPEPPAFTPRAAAPLGNPGGWATEADYPGADLRAGHAGTTRFRLSVASDGHVSGCTVIVSSGWPGLDAATCRLVTARARFRPATDGTGTATEGSFSSAIRWVIPN